MKWSNFFFYGSLCLIFQFHSLAKATDLQCDPDSSQTTSFHRFLQPLAPLWFKERNPCHNPYHDPQREQRCEQISSALFTARANLSEQDLGACFEKWQGLSFNLCVGVRHALLGQECHLIKGQGTDQEEIRAICEGTHRGLSGFSQDCSLQSASLPDVLKMASCYAFAHLPLPPITGTKGFDRLAAKIYTSLALPEKDLPSSANSQKNPLSLISLDPYYLGEERARSRLNYINLPNFGRAVKYFDAEERKRYQVTFLEGKIYVPYNTLGRKAYYDPKEQLEINYVQSPEGTVYMGNEHSVGKHHHSSYLAGAPVKAAGTVTRNIQSGQSLTSVSNDSGHYKPTYAHVQQFLQKLKQEGVALQGTEFEIYLPGPSGELTHWQQELEDLSAETPPKMPLSENYRAVMIDGKIHMQIGAVISPEDHTEYVIDKSGNLYLFNGQGLPPALEPLRAQFVESGTMKLDYGKLIEKKVHDP